MVTVVKLDGTSKSLQKLFRVYNRAYFRGELDPSIKVRFSRVSMKQTMAMYDGENEEIVIDKQFRRLRRLCCFFLLHEMSHIYRQNPNCGPNNRAHNAIMLGLAKIGALRGIW